MKLPMKLLMINYEFPPLGGGGANANYYILSEFSGNSSIDVHLITSSESASDYREQFSGNITVHRLGVGKKNLHYWTQREILTFIIRAGRYAKKLVKEIQFDLGHAFFGFPSGYITYRMRKELPYIISLRGSDVPGFNERFSLQYRVLTPLFRRIWRASNKIIANSNDLSLLAKKTIPEIPIDIIYNGINSEKFSPALKNEKGRKNILVVSRLIRRKGLEYMIAALPFILKSHSEVKLTIAGEGNLKEELETLAGKLGVLDNISFSGRVEHDRLPELYRDSDIFVLPSLWEGMSNSVLEALASGLPVVVTDTGGTKELVKENGIIIVRESEVAIADAVLKILGDDPLRAAMGKKSRDIALGFTWASVAENYLQLYKEVSG